MSQYLSYRFDNKLILFLLYNPSNINITFPIAGFSNINKQFYKQLIQESNNKLMTIVCKYCALSNNNLNNMSFYYNYYYLKMVYNLVHQLHIDYIWSPINPNKFYVANNQVLQDMKINRFEKNPYLNQSNSLQKLSEDILTRGSLFPFTYFQNEDNQYALNGGKHRFFSLLNNPKTKKQEFLFLDLSKIDLTFHRPETIYTFYNKLNTELFKEEQEVFIFSNDGVFQTFTKSPFIYYLLFNNAAEWIVRQSYDYRNEIKPHPIFNNKNAWEKFINSPFQEIAELENFQ